MSDLYSIKDVAQIFGLEESRLRYWAQTGFVNPSERRRGRMYYTFRDLVAVRAAKGLLDAGLSVQKVRKNLDALRALLPDVTHPASKMHIVSDGENVVAVDRGMAFEPTSGQVVMSFAVEALSRELGHVAPLPDAAHAAEAEATPADHAATDQTDSDAHSASADPDRAPTEPGEPATGYQCFVQGCEAEAQGETELATELYRQAIARQPSLASAHTNLGNLLYRSGDLMGARDAYEHALELEPAQAEARFNLGNLLEDLGETELAIAELRRVCWTHPEFADAHYNLGLVLARVGGLNQARRHLERYLELDGDSDWAERARSFLGAIGGGSRAAASPP
ncbi:tetratricopeptide repeat protein [Haliangium sp.]|uniref:helix-turn-helix domain-containing protein n=1 Tax=Haliangium sp. TaxID=2663208 RepID=UPI003D0F021B